jgi:hypothetical protein
MSQGEVRKLDIPAEEGYGVYWCACFLENIVIGKHEHLKRELTHARYMAQVLMASRHGASRPEAASCLKLKCSAFSPSEGVMRHEIASSFLM